MMNGPTVQTRRVMAGLCFLLAVSFFLAACGQSATTAAEPTAEAQKLSEFPSPGPSPVDLAWNGTTLWVADDETNLLYQVDPISGEPARWEVGWEAEHLQGVAWDAQNLWVLDGEAAVIQRLDPNTGEETHSIKAPESNIEGDWSYAGMAWDGQFLWVAISAAWCSTLNRIDPGTGEIVVSFFPQCNPRGLASNGELLWTIAYNGEELPSKLDQRLLSDKAGDMAQSQEFLFDLDVVDPTALTYGDGILWVADRAEGGRIIQVNVR